MKPFGVQGLRAFLECGSASRGNGPVIVSICEADSKAARDFLSKTWLEPPNGWMRFSENLAGPRGPTNTTGWRENPGGGAALPALFLQLRDLAEVLIKFSRPWSWARMGGSSMGRILISEQRVEAALLSKPLSMGDWHRVGRRLCWPKGLLGAAESSIFETGPHGFRTEKNSAPPAPMIC